MNYFKKNQAIVSGKIHTVQGDVIWLEQPNENPKQVNFIEVRFANNINFMQGQWLFLQGRLNYDKNNQRNFIEITNEYGILGVVGSNSVAGCCMAMCEFAGNVGKIENKGEWTSISLAVTVTDLINDQYIDETVWVNVSIKSSKLSKRPINKGDFVYFSSSMSVNQYEVEGVKKMAYNFYINQLFMIDKKKGSSQPSQSHPSQNQNSQPQAGNFIPPSM